MDRQPFPLLIAWDYVLITEWYDGESYQEGPEPLLVIPASLAQALEQWSGEMGDAYADETGAVNPSRAEAHALDVRFDELVDDLRAEGFDVVQGDKWWRGR
ncbi:hypothetical protein DEO23_02865 [Brachybacterium endophyticum]|uniref:Uncharacterized protein n=1 Tax=Brachybacterium endophyticum TaxID=2182385 RepID=A0A2U2RP03_9MICO|nr:hypothetical protein [Brachybacterium endophyticum]PWH07586.1 hypothetical protein DEO23_02865 [Brachybacterium endophyticum]